MNFHEISAQIAEDEKFIHIDAEALRMRRYIKALLFEIERLRHLLEDHINGEDSA